MACTKPELLADVGKQDTTSRSVCASLAGNCVAWIVIKQSALLSLDESSAFEPGTRLPAQELELWIGCLECILESFICLGYRSTSLSKVVLPQYDQTRREAGCTGFDIIVLRSNEYHVSGLRGSRPRRAANSSKKRLHFFGSVQ